MKKSLLLCLIVIAFLSLGFSDNYKIRDLEYRISNLENKIRGLKSHDHDYDYADKNHDHDYAEKYHSHSYADEFHSH